MPDSPQTPYQQLERRFKRLSALSEAEAVLHWDMSAMMPRGGAADLAELDPIGREVGPEIPAPEASAL